MRNELRKAFRKAASRDFDTPPYKDGWDWHINIVMSVLEKYLILGFIQEENYWLCSSRNKINAWGMGDTPLTALKDFTKFFINDVKFLRKSKLGDALARKLAYIECVLAGGKE